MMKSRVTGALGGGTGLREAGAAPVCSFNFRSNHREKIKLPDGGNRQQELAKDPHSMQISLRNKTRDGGVGKSKRRGVTSVASSHFYFLPKFPGRRERVA